ncbi:hypothetical protein [Veillonella seminalis]|uniref:Uncharacterized protein n=1 Tax=Veillonella seminalis ACS-216-V-Col6b TaxID=883156 RepID=K9DJ27_9FIRM|nr:hypothetical protein [Veillonella seminalis]EKU77405.1 hypothetical protein HMPREF9282_02122 [Veillonella seminalis ACS-216-V-Col6b]
MGYYLKTIPETDKNNYISGWYSLNASTNKEKAVDWHSLGHWYSKKENEILETTKYNPILKYKGIYYGELTFPIIKKVYIASHVRAILDIIYKTITTEKTQEQFNQLNFLKGDIYNFFPEEKDRQNIFSLLIEMQTKTNSIQLKNFIRNELPKEYYNYVYEGANYVYTE